MTEIRSLLMEVNPVQSAEVPDKVRAELFAEVRRTPPPRRLTLRPWRWPLPSILIGLVAAGGLATAANYLISQDTKDQSAALVSGPQVRGEDGVPATYGAQVRATANAILATTPSPPGYEDDLDYEHMNMGGPGVMSGSLEILIQHRAACRWRTYWIDAVERGRTQAAADAAQILHEATQWPGVRGDRGQALAMAERAAQAAADGDVAEMRAASQVDCRGSP